MVWSRRHGTNIHFILILLSPLKTCLQFFKVMPKEVSPLVWDETEEGTPLQSILGSLVHIIMGKVSL